MVDFCKAINSGREPRQYSHGFFLLREDDHLKEVAGWHDPSLRQDLSSALATEEDPDVRRAIEAVLRRQGRP
jgi:hypothetical protein